MSRLLLLIPILLLASCRHTHPTFCQTGSAPGPQVCISHIPTPIPVVPNPVPSKDLVGLENQALTLRSALQTALARSDVIRVVSGTSSVTPEATAYDRGISDGDVLSAFGEFDPNLNLGMQWERIDLPPNASADGAFQRRSQLDVAVWEAGITQKLKMGGQVGASLDVPYNFFPPAQNTQGFINPQYLPGMTFFASQPIAKGAGRAVNLAPIEIEAAEARQTAWEFKQSVMGLVRSVEEAYFRVYATRKQLEAIDDVLPLYVEVARVSRERVDAEQEQPAVADQADVKVNEKRRARIELQIAVQNAENLLRNVLGLPPDLRTPIELSETPFDREVTIDWEETLLIAINQRPDVMRQRLAIRVRELELLLAKNSLKPQIDANGHWRLNGIGNRLDDALSLLGDNQFTDWGLGFTIQLPIRRRNARGKYQAAGLALIRDRALLDQVAHSAGHELAVLVGHFDPDRVFARTESDQFGFTHGAPPEVLYSSESN